MKVNGYAVRVEAGAVVVELRRSTAAAVESGCVVLFLAAMVGLPRLGDLDRARDASDVAFALSLLLVVPLLAGFGWLRAARGEVMRCDGRELQFARRRMVGRWRRFRFASGEVKELQRGFRSTGKSGYVVVTFQHDGNWFDMLENIGREDALQVLKACKALGMDVVLPDTSGDAMLRDIEKRGWWVNPLKPDRGE
jgi:hypothetical protein